MSSEEIVPATPAPKNRKVAFEEPDEEEEDYYEEEETDEEEEEGGEEEEEDELTDLLANTLVTPEGDTLCGTLVRISDTLETQNKILIKLLSTLAKRG